MKKNILLLIVISLSCLIANAQAPEKINYQAVARDVSGNPLVNQTLNVTYEIRQSSPTGTSVYTETHSGISTNQFGLFTAEIGSGIPSVGTFAGINWGAGLHYLYVEVNGDPMGTSQLLSVPYALYAKQSANGPQGVPGKNSISIVTSEPAGANCQNGGNKIDVGTDDNNDNMLQTLEIDFTYYVCNGDSGSAAGDDWGNQVIISQGNNISGDGTTANPLNVFDNDTSATNEIQDLSISGNTIGITGGTGINLSPTAPGTGQVLTWNGTAWIAQNAGSGADNWGTQVVISNTTLTGDGTAGNPLGVNGVLTDNQDLTLTGNTLSLTNDPTPINLTPYLDNTDAQTLSLNTNVLSISNGNNVTLPTPPTYTAGTGINLSGNVITNTAPDQTVALTNGTGINVTGTYPNFTINNTSPASSTNITGGGLTTVTGTSPTFTVNTPAQTLTYTAPNLTLSNGGGTVTIPPSPWAKTGSTIHELTAGDNVGVGITNAEGSLHVRSTSTQIKLGHPNQPTAEWVYDVNASGLLNVINENYGTPLTVMSMTNLGLVGVGTTVPTANLHLDGTLRLNNLGGSTPAIGSVLTSIDAQGNAEWQPPTTTTTYWSPNGTDIYNNNSGNVGIGTSVPNVALHIQGTNTSTTLNAYGGSPETALRLFNTDITPNNFSSIAFTTMLSNSASAEMGKIVVQNVNHTIGSVQGDMVFMTRNSSNLNEVMRITGNSNVGIGTISPEQKLDVIGYTRIGAGAGNANMGLLLATPAPGIALIRAGGRAYTDFRIEQENNAPITFHTSNAERVRIDGNGDVGIGTTTPSQKLDIDGGGSIEVDGEYTYETAKTRTISIPINALNQKRNNSSSVNAFLIHESYVGGYYGESGYCYFSGGTNAVDAVATAPIYLPQGAVVTELKVKWFDTNTTLNATLSLERIGFNTINNDQMAVINTTGSTTSISGLATSTDNTILNGTIDNTNYSYYVKMFSKEATTNVGFAKIVISYTVIQAD